MSMLATFLAVWALAVLALLALASFSCSNVQVFVWPTFVRCAEQPAALVLMVNQVLQEDGTADEVSADVAAALDDLARKVGGDKVACALHTLIIRYRETQDGAPTTLFLPRAARAERFLRDRGVTIESPGPG